MRTQPVYLLIDVSGSMRGAAIEAARVGMQTLHVALAHSAALRDTAEFCVMTFGHDVEVARPLSPLRPGERPPPIRAPEPGPTHLGLALRELRSQVAEAAAGPGPGRRPPIVCVMTDGVPTDIALFEAEADALGRMPLRTVLCCIAGPRGRREPLERLTRDVVSLDVTTLAFWDDLFGQIEVDAGVTAVPEPMDWLAPPEHQVVI